MRTGQDFTPDFDIFRSGLVTGTVVFIQAIALEFLFISTCDKVEQDTSIGKTVESRCHAGGERRRGNAWTEGHQKLKLSGGINQAGSCNPWVFTGTACWNQYAIIAQVVNGHCNLFHIGMIDLTRTLAGA